MVGIHVHRVEAEVLRLECAVVDGDGAVACSTLGLQRDTSCQSGKVVIHAEEGAVAQLRDGHRVLIGVPTHECLPVAHIGEAVFLFDKDGVGLRHHRVRHEEILVGEGCGGEIFKLSLTAEAAVTEVYDVVERAFAAIGRVSVLRCIDAEA